MDIKWEKVGPNSKVSPYIVRFRKSQKWCGARQPHPRTQSSSIGSGFHGITTYFSIIFIICSGGSFFTEKLTLEKDTRIYNSSIEAQKKKTCSNPFASPRLSSLKMLWVLLLHFDYSSPMLPLHLHTTDTEADNLVSSQNYNLYLFSFLLLFSFQVKRKKR